MAATGSHSPAELAQSVAQIVAGCKDQIRGNADHSGATDVDSHAASAARNNRGIGQCVSSQVTHNRNGEAHQQANGVSDAGDRETTSPSPSPSTHQDHGQGNGRGSVGAPSQGGAGHGSGTGGQGNSDSHSHRPKPTPTPS